MSDQREIASLVVKRSGKDGQNIIMELRLSSEDEQSFPIALSYVRVVIDALLKHANPS